MILYSLVTIISSHSHGRGKCGYRHNIIPELKVADPLPKHITEDPQRRKLYGTAHPIKLQVDVSNVRGISQELKEYLLKLVVTKGNQIFAQKIRVKSQQYIQGSSSIQSSCSYQNIVKVPDHYRNNDTKADFLLFLATDNTGNDGTLAYATACYLEQGTNRPNVGLAVFNPYYLNPNSGKLDNDVATYVHEVLHALVFSSQLFKRFPPYNGKSQYFISNGNHYLRGPNLLQTARQHFGCNQINSIPLEDDGGDGSKGGHFERIVFGDETMVSEDVPIAKFSKMTLALLKDSGWYEIDLGMGDHYTWGKGEGCAMFQNSCTYGKVEEKCSQNNNFGCDKTFKYKMKCKRTTFTGSCNIKTKGETCLKAHKGMYNFESASHNSKCQEFYYKGSKKAACVNLQCNSSNTAYQVTLKSDNGPVKYTCRKEHEVFSWGNNFKFICENPKIICGDLCPKSCHNRGKCLENGYCACDPFFSGAICGTFNGCQGLSQNLCKNVVNSNRLDTKNYGNKYSSADYDSNYLRYSSWSDTGAGNTVKQDNASGTSYNSGTSGTNSYNNTGGNTGYNTGGTSYGGNTGYNTGGTSYGGNTGYNTGGSSYGGNTGYNSGGSSYGGNTGYNTGGSSYGGSSYGGSSYGGSSYGGSSGYGGSTSYGGNSYYGRPRSVLINSMVSVGLLLISLIK